MITNETKTILQKHLNLNRHSRYQNTQEKKIPHNVQFQHSQITKQEFEKLAELLLKYSMVSLNLHNLLER